MFTVKKRLYIMEIHDKIFYGNYCFKIKIKDERINVN